MFFSLSDPLSLIITTTSHNFQVGSTVAMTPARVTVVVHQWPFFQVCLLLNVSSYKLVRFSYERSNFSIFGTGELHPLQKQGDFGNRIDEDDYEPEHPEVGRRTGRTFWTMTSAGMPSAVPTSVGPDKKPTKYVYDRTVPTLVGIVSWGLGCARPTYAGVNSINSNTLVTSTYNRNRCNVLNLK